MEKKLWVGLGVNWSRWLEFDDYSTSPKSREILLHWGYELIEKDFFNELSN